MKVRAIIILISILLTMLTSCHEHGARQIVDMMNDSSYYFHYRNLDSTTLYARRALKLSSDYEAGRAEAYNNLAFVSIAKMHYEEAWAQLDSAMKSSDNQLEQLIADVQLMRLCQRESRNKDFYVYSGRAQRRINRIMETDEINDDPRSSHRLMYGMTERAIVLSTYLYYIGQYTASADVLLQVERQRASFSPIQSSQLYASVDTAQLLAYYYNIGAGGILTSKSEDETMKHEMNYLMQCLQIADSQGYTFWIAQALEGISEHLKIDKNLRSIKRDTPAIITYLNRAEVGDSLLAGNLALQSRDIFECYGDVYQTSGANRTLAECYFHVSDYHSALSCLEEALYRDTAINKAPDLVASIREQFSLCYSAIGDKTNSDINRNIYQSMQDSTRQDRALEARASELEASTKQLNIYVGAALASILLLSISLYIFSRMRRRADRRCSLQSLLSPLKQWQEQQQSRIADIESIKEDIEQQLNINKDRLWRNRQINIEGRAKVAVVNSITPLIDRLLREEASLMKGEDTPRQRAERYEYMTELLALINEYNGVLTRWIQLRQGEIRLKIESFELNELFDIVKSGAMGFELKKINLHVEPTTSIVKADRTLTLFMLNTLADNARKATNIGGKVNISAKEMADYVEISVSDTGIGIDANRLPELFCHTALQNEQQESLQVEHHGFGLMNCKGIIEKYKKMSAVFSVCDIGVESEKGRGSRFYFRLPKGKKSKPNNTYASVGATMASILGLGLMFTFAIGCGGYRRPSVNAKDTISIKTDSQKLATLEERAYALAEWTYESNVEGTYDLTIRWADSCITYLNGVVHMKCQENIDTMKLYDVTGGQPAELVWYNKAIPLNYTSIMNMRNEVAVAALVRHDWQLYKYNDKASTQLYRLMTSDKNISNYVSQMERQNINQNIAIIMLVLILLAIFPAYYFLYYRHRLAYNMCASRVNDINSTLLSNQTDRQKLDAIEHIWTAKLDSQARQEGFNDLCTATDAIRAALIASINEQDKRSVDNELARDELRRTKMEIDRLHVENAVLDNSLSALKHETMYYPSRIAKLIENKGESIFSINELTAYYRQLHGLFARQAQEQLVRNMHVDKQLMTYLLHLLLERNVDLHDVKSLTNPKNRDSVIITVTLPRQFNEQQAAQLFTPSTIDMRYFVCRQILREAGEERHSRGDGIRAYNKDGQTMAEITINKQLWNSLR